ncbi:unnamed protein product [Closterium sp. NIES-54]
MSSAESAVLEGGLISQQLEQLGAQHHAIQHRLHLPLPLTSPLLLPLSQLPPLPHSHNLHDRKGGVGGGLQDSQHLPHALHALQHYSRATHAVYSC